MIDYLKILDAMLHLVDEPCTYRTMISVFFLLFFFFFIALYSKMASMLLETFTFFQKY